jgi:hypothetical protein
MKKIYALAIFFALTNCEVSAQSVYNQVNTPEDVSYQMGIYTVFPNPAANNVSIVLNFTPIRKLSVEIIDFNGRLRRAYSFAPGGYVLNFDVSFLEQGQFIVRVLDRGRLVGRARLLKGIELR